MTIVAAIGLLTLGATIGALAIGICCAASRGDLTPPHPNNEDRGGRP